MLFPKNIPQGIKVVSWATGIRWFGWGFVEALLPIFMYKFSESYLETGLLSASYWILFFLIMPIIGALADKISSKKLLIAGLLMYPFVGLGYTIAGITGMAIFILIARILNGAAYAIDTVARNTYIRRYAPKNMISTAYGYFNIISNSWWIAALLISYIIVQYVELHWMFLAISITAIGAIILIKTKLNHDIERKTKVGLIKSYKNVLYDIKKWNSGLKYLGFFILFAGFVEVIADFFVPIYIYRQEENLQKIILLTAVMASPALFGNPLGRIADRLKSKSIIIGLIALIPLIAILAFAPYIWQLVIVFLITSILHLFWLSVEGLITPLTKHTHYGRVESTFQIIGNISSIIGPIAVGLIIATAGESKAFIYMALISVIVLLVMIHARKKIDIVSIKRFK